MDTHNVWMTTCAKHGKAPPPSMTASLMFRSHCFVKFLCRTLSPRIYKLVGLINSVQIILLTTKQFVSIPFEVSMKSSFNAWNKSYGVSINTLDTMSLPLLTRYNPFSVHGGHMTTSQCFTTFKTLVDGTTKDYL